MTQNLCKPELNEYFLGFVSPSNTAPGQEPWPLPTSPVRNRKPSCKTARQPERYLHRVLATPPRCRAGGKAGEGWGAAGARAASRSNLCLLQAEQSQAPSSRRREEILWRGEVGLKHHIPRLLRALSRACEGPRWEPGPGQGAWLVLAGRCVQIAARPEQALAGLSPAHSLLGALGNGSWRQREKQKGAGRPEVRSCNAESGGRQSLSRGLN